jgi:hypothetical protein
LPKHFNNQLQNYDSAKVLASLSAFQLVHANSEKTPFIEFAVASYLSDCKFGTKEPPMDEIKQFLSAVGNLFKKKSANEKINPLNAAFSGHHMYMRHIGAPAQKMEAYFRRFKMHNDFIIKKLGFSVDASLIFVTGMLNQIYAKVSTVSVPNDIELTKEDYYDFSFFVEPTKDLISKWADAITFTKNEMQDIFAVELHGAFDNYLNKMTLDLDENLIFDSTNCLSSNPFWIKPIVKIGKKLLIPFPPYLLDCLSKMVHNELTYDPAYAGTYMSKKGGVAESWVADLLQKIFPTDQIHQNVRYDRHHGYPDADIIVEHKDFLVFIECTTRWLSETTMKGDVGSIRKDLDKSVRKCYNQALRAIDAYKKGLLKIDLKGNPKKFITIIMTDTLYPNLTIDLKYGSYLNSLVRHGMYPYIISLFDLDDITDVVDADLFVEFIQERLRMFNQPNIICLDELDYLRFYLKPEYQEMKESINKKQISLIYTGHGDPIPKLHVDTLLSEVMSDEKFAILKIDDMPLEQAPYLVMKILYSIYHDYDVVLKHMVLSLKNYHELIDSYKSQGKTCKAIGWEGMEEYLTTFAGSEGKEFFSQLTQHGTEDVNLIVTCETDMFKKLNINPAKKKS